MERKPKGDFFSKHRSTDELAKLICKLRWIGLEDEALRIQRLLRRIPPEERPSVLIQPFSTD